MRLGFSVSDLFLRPTNFFPVVSFTPWNVTSVPVRQCHFVLCPFLRRPRVSASWILWWPRLSIGNGVTLLWLKISRDGHWLILPDPEVYWNSPLVRCHWRQEPGRDHDPTRVSVTWTPCLVSLWSTPPVHSRAQYREDSHPTRRDPLWERRTQSSLLSCLLKQNVAPMVEWVSFHLIVLLKTSRIKGWKRGLPVKIWVVPGLPLGDVTVQPGSESSLVVDDWFHRNPELFL